MTMEEAIRDLQARLNEAEETLRALRSGEVDAVVVSGPGGDSVFTLKGADEPYRIMVEGMSEGAVTLTSDGLILFSNAQFANLVGTPQEQVVGAHIQEFVAVDDAQIFTGLLRGRLKRKAELRLRSRHGGLVPVYFSVENLVLDASEVLCLIVTDLSEQKRNAEIVAAERLTRSILDQAAEAIVVVDPEGLIMRANRAAEQLAGMPVLSRTLEEVFRISLHMADCDRSMDEIRALVQASGRVRNLGATATSADGRTVDLLLSAATLSSDQDELLGFVLHLQDITERRETERQLRFQADLLENTSEAVIAIDDENRITYWNRGAERLYSTARKDAIGQTIARIQSPLWPDNETERRVRAALAKKGAWSGENVYFAKDGERIVVSATINRIHPQHGGGAFAVIRDISEAKKAEETLRASEARERQRASELEAIMEAAPVAVAIARDRECRIITGNRMLYQMLRAESGTNVSPSAQELDRPRTWRQMKNGRELAPDNLPMQIAAASGLPVHDDEMELAFDDGTTRFWLGSAVPLFDEGGNPRGAVGAFVDITERKIAEERLRLAQKWESIGVLAGGIAHDFNNLLVGVVGYASLALEMVAPDDPVSGFLDKVIATGDKLAMLTRQILAYAGQGRFVIEQLDLSDITRKMLKLVLTGISSRIEIVLELESNPPAVAGDRGQLQQLFLSLVHNAAEAIGEAPGVITIRTGVRTVERRFANHDPRMDDLAPGAYVYLEVSDTGCGMDAATMAKIFDPFFSTKFLGRGLGLAAASGIARGHKGVIRVTSEPGRGSCFTVLLPAAAAPARVAVAAPRESVKTADAGVVLLIDDEEVVRSTAETGLRLHGFDVLVASNGEEGIDLLATHGENVALAVLDLNMPGMDGHEVLPELRKIRPDLKVLVSSGYEESETLAIFGEQAVDGFLHKPYTARKLVEAVRGALNSATEGRGSL